MSKEPRNLLIPFRRDLKNDFASGTGEDLERSKVTQVLATEGATEAGESDIAAGQQAADRAAPST